ncbi:MAG: hypothetical protein ABSD74_17795, partial [Rhizomicrobium sp.]
MSQTLMFKLAQAPSSNGLRCDADGLFLARNSLLRKDDEGHFQPRAAPDLRQIFSGLYGNEADWESRIRSVNLVAKALNKGDMARAAMTAVLMRLPDPEGPDCFADQRGPLAKAGFNPDELRDERGRWAIGGNDGSDSNVTDRTPRVQLADSGF